jgi:UDP-N-acetylglucosamine--N-acetylmuramyl-(pentapeptide) pyrophosphoryl-undecaprenol N-acetylglucosamine transferase
VLGGGSGSQILNKGLRNALPQLSDYSVIHLCGKNNVEKLTVENYRQFEYLSDIGDAYAAADVVVARSGAGTAFELMALKKLAIFIPLEGQTRGDQIENAEYFEKRGLCKVLRQTELEKLPAKIEEILQDVPLQRNLTHSTFPIGNEKILSAIKAKL